MGKSQTFVIAEAGVNHNGSLALAKRLIEAAAQAGADAIKFQAFRADKLVSSQARKAEYQKATTGDGTQHEMLKKLELSPESFKELASHAAKVGIEFMSSAFDEESLALVVSLGVSRLKLGSGELTNGPMLLACGRTRLPLILSTGMGTLEEIRESLSLLASVYSSPELKASANWRQAGNSERGKRALSELVTLLHCTTEYPCPFDQVDLLAMNRLNREFGLPVGYSDHTEGAAVSIAAVALGARIIEKHFTLDRSLPGPDHRASIDPPAFAELVRGIREVEASLGREEKYVRSAEQGNKDVARRSLVASRPIVAGAAFSADNLTSKRPGTGVSPMMLWDLIGKVSSRAYAEDEQIDEEELK